MNKLRQIVTRTAPLHATPDKFSEMVSEMIFGETLEVFEDHNGWIKAKSLRDGYEGYISKEGLSESIFDPTHQICALQSFVYRKPDYKSPPLTTLPFLSRITVMEDEVQNGFMEMEGGGWIWAGHLEDITARQEDFTATALRFIGMPYLWGGRTSRGLDCSGLVQTALLAAGIPCPRDTKDQLKIGQALEFGDTIQYATLQRGDLVFFERHVGIMVDENRILNATARTMDTRIENLEEMTRTYPGGIIACRRV